MPFNGLSACYFCRNKTFITMRTTTPFLDFGLEWLNPKALFEDFSHEAGQVGIYARLSYLKLFVQSGYDLADMAKEYLVGKDENIMPGRLDAVLSTFQHYNDQMSSNGDFADSPNKTTVQALNKVIRAFSTLIVDYDTDVTLKKAIGSYVLSHSSGMVDGWSIDLHADLQKSLEKRDEREGMNNLWSYKALWEYFKRSLLPSILGNRLPQNCDHPILEMPAVQIWNVYLKKFFPEEDLHLLEENPELLNARLLDCAAYVVKVLWLGFPLFDEKVFIVRCNYKQEHNRKEIQRLFDETKTSICIQENEPADQRAYDDLMSNAKKPSKIPLYIQRFVSLYQEAQRNDIIVITSYMGVGIKIGLIKKGTPIAVESFDRTATSPAFKLYCLSMKSAYCTPAIDHYRRMEAVDITRFPLINSILPQQVTISPVYKRKDSVYAIYYGLERKKELKHLAESDMERICMEWLRSEYAPKEYRLAYQLTAVGGNYATADILGDNYAGQRIVAQVSFTYDENRVRNKSEKLMAFNGDFYLMFSMVRSAQRMAYGCLQIHIEDVWTDLVNDAVYGSLIDRLLES